MEPLLERRALDNDFFFFFLSMLDKISHGRTGASAWRSVCFGTPFAHVYSVNEPDNSHLSTCTLQDCAFISYACAEYNDENRIELKLLCVFVKMKHSIANYFIKQNKRGDFLVFAVCVTLCLWWLDTNTKIVNYTTQQYTKGPVM